MNDVYFTLREDGFIISLSMFVRFIFIFCVGGHACNGPHQNRSFRTPINFQGFCPITFFLIQQERHVGSEM